MSSSYKYHVISTNAELITSPFGYRMFNNKREHHDGIDFVDALRREKTSDVYIKAFADGKAVMCGSGVSVGNYADILHKGNILTRYFHMKNGSLRVKTGQTVKRGDIIGIMGTTGNSTGIHLHFGLKENSTFYNNGVYVDPSPYLYGVKNIPDNSGGNNNTVVTPDKSISLKSGDKVKVLCQNDRTAQTYDGKRFKCYFDVYDVIQVSGDRVVIGIGKVTSAAVNKNILVKL